MNDNKTNKHRLDKSDKKSFIRQRNMKIIIKKKEQKQLYFVLVSYHGQSLTCILLHVQQH